MKTKEGVPGSGKACADYWRVERGVKGVAVNPIFSQIQDIFQSRNNEEFCLLVEGVLLVVQLGAGEELWCRKK